MLLVEIHELLMILNLSIKFPHKFLMKPLCANIIFSVELIIYLFKSTLFFICGRHHTYFYFILLLLLLSSLPLEKFPIYAHSIGSYDIVIILEIMSSVVCIYLSFNLYYCYCDRNCIQFDIYCIPQFSRCTHIANSLTQDLCLYHTLLSKACNILHISHIYFLDDRIWDATISLLPQIKLP